jgi:small subunit ribosomal protein S30e
MPTHGSLTKAGKVRAQTPKVEKTSHNTKTIPRLKNRSKFKKMQYYQNMDTRRRRRRR